MPPALLEYDSDAENEYLNESTNAPTLLACDGAARKNIMVNSKSDDECECEFDVGGCDYVEMINSGDVLTSTKTGG